MPAFIPIVIGATVVSGAVYYFQRDEDGIVERITKETFDQLAEQGIPIVEGITEAFGTLGAQTLEVIEGAGIAIMKATETAVDYATSKVAPHRVDAVAITTAMIIYGATAFTIINRIRSR